MTKTDDIYYEVVGVSNDMPASGTFYIDVFETREEAEKFIESGALPLQYYHDLQIVEEDYSERYVYDDDFNDWDDDLSETIPDEGDFYPDPEQWGYYDHYGS